MTVYVVVETSDEHEYLVGVYSTRATAEAVAIKRTLDGYKLDLSIHEIVLDYDPPMND